MESVSGAAPTFLPSATPLAIHRIAGVIHTTYTISPTLVNEAAFNYNGNRINIIPFAGSGFGELGAFPLDTLVRIRDCLVVQVNNLSRIPNIDLTRRGRETHFSKGSPVGLGRTRRTITRSATTSPGPGGAHQIKMGGSWALYKKVQDLFGQTQGGFGFDGTFTSNDFADYLLGDAKSYQELAVQDKGLWNNVSWATYVQDNWRFNRKLTLNLGLRWDGVPHTYEANNRMGNFYPSLYDPTKKAVLNPDGTINANSPGLGFSPNPIIAIGGKPVPLYLNGIRYSWPERRTEGLGRQPLGELRSSYRFCLRPERLRQDRCPRRIWRDVRAHPGQ